MKAVHFGAGNIGRGFIGEILSENGYEITFVDVNDKIIDALKERHEYTIELADKTHEKIHITKVNGVNNSTEPEKVIAAIVEADIITTAIGPNILPHIAELIAQGIDARKSNNVTEKIDVVACENMIGGSTFLGEEVGKYIEDKDYMEEYVGFPDAAVDRIVPMQQHEDPLYVQVEPFSEWIIDDSKRKNKEITLKGVEYVENLEPYIERKLFSVNTGHATVAYTGALLGYKKIDEAMEDSLVVAQLKSVLHETGQLLIEKWGFDPLEHEKYINKIIHRFQNKDISDSISRVARTPLRKLGYQERFIRPIRELKDLNHLAPHLTATIGMVFNYYDPEDEQSRELHQMMEKNDINEVIEEITGIDDPNTVSSIKDNVKRYAEKVA